MLSKNKLMKASYKQDGYVLLRGLFTGTELSEVKSTVNKFHESWIKENKAFYEETAINSAYLTGKTHLDEYHRKILFKFIASKKILDAVSIAIDDKPAFMNTQLFFNPVNVSKKNYWHRDTQYDLTLDEQKAALSGPNVLHFRIALEDEPGVEVVPQTHKRWDTNEELDIRLETNDRKNYQDISQSLKIKLNEGDVLIFSANMIHRGLYGLNRLALDLLFCDSDLNLLKFSRQDCLPESEIIDELECKDVFINTINLKSNNCT